MDVRTQFSETIMLLGVRTSKRYAHTTTPLDPTIYGSKNRRVRKPCGRTIHGPMVSLAQQNGA